MSEPVFSEVCYTGQPMTQNEEVLCPVCKDHSSLLHLRYNAWYDAYCSEPRIRPQIPGLYVHFNCLSEQRKQELGISLQAYTAAVQEIGETLFKIRTARLANNPNRSAVFAQSFKENQSLRIEIVPRPYFASDDDPEFTTNVKFMGYDEDNLKPSPAAMYAVITQKDDLLKPLNEELTSYTPKE